MKSWLMTVSHSSQTAESMEIASNSPSCLELDPSLKWLNKLGERATCATILLTKPAGTETYHSETSCVKVLTNPI